METSRKLGFWSVFALVTGSQIGTGIFVSLVSLAPFGLLSLAGWAIAGLGAISLALVFAQLCAWMPKTGGPHVYVHEAFGATIAFFTGWTYWVISWVSTTTVIVAAVSYLTPFFGHHPTTNVTLGIVLLILITALNFRGVSTAGHVEFALTLLKVIPLICVPLMGLWYFNLDNFTLDAPYTTLSIEQVVGHAVLIAFYGFIGLESGTTPAASVHNPSKTIPKAVVFGTLCVAGLYILNSVGIMGVLPSTQLMKSHAPYADAIKIIIGGNWHLLISLIASIICIGTLNAWMLTSGQIALGLAQDRFLPRLFGRTNKYGAPYISLAISCVGIIPLLIMTNNNTLASQINFIVDVSSVTFLFVYTVCCLAFFKLLLEKKYSSASMSSVICGIFALLFCLWVIYATPAHTLGVASLFICSGIPLFIRFLLHSHQASKN
jgi:basic amino acid/polyamine antiporter, APA family